MTSVHTNIKPIVKQRLSKKIQLLNWSQVDSTHFEEWCKKTTSVLCLYRKLPVIMFQMDELFRYLLLSDVLENNVRIHRDEEHIHNLFISSSNNKTNLNLQSPEETFEEKVESDPCPKCRLTETLTIPIQRRSADEPISYYSQCLNCKHRWRTS